jgi:hypothetical protein
VEKGKKEYHNVTVKNGNFPALQKKSSIVKNRNEFLACVY